MEEDIKRWRVKRKSALVLDIIQGKTTVAEASQQYDLSRLEVEQWVDDGKRGMENDLRANPQDVRERYERQLKDLQEAYGEAMLELRARKKLQSLLGEDESDRDDPPGLQGHGRTGNPHAEGTMRASASLRDYPTRQPHDRRLDTLLQPPAPTPGAWHEDPG